MSAVATRPSWELQQFAPVTLEAELAPVLALVHELEISLALLVCAGSWSIVAAGVRLPRMPGDADLVVEPPATEILKGRAGWMIGRHESTGDLRLCDEAGRFDVSTCWPDPWGEEAWTVPRLRARANFVGGVAFAELGLAEGYKEVRGTWKDLEDLAAIRAHKALGS